MKPWQKGIIFLIVFIILFRFFIKIDYPEYEVYEIKFTQPLDDDETNRVCNEIWEGLIGASGSPEYNVFCESKSSDTIYVWVTGFSVHEIYDGPNYDLPSVESSKEIKRKRLRILINEKRIY